MTFSFKLYHKSLVHLFPCLSRLLWNIFCNANWLQTWKILPCLCSWPAFPYQLINMSLERIIFINFVKWKQLAEKTAAATNDNTASKWNMKENIRSNFSRKKKYMFMYTLYTMSLEIGRPSGYFVLCFSIGHPNTVHIFLGIWTWVVVVVATMLEEKTKVKFTFAFSTHSLVCLLLTDRAGWPALAHTLFTFCRIKHVPNKLCLVFHLWIIQPKSNSSGPLFRNIFCNCF